MKKLKSTYKIILVNIIFSFKILYINFKFKFEKVNQTAPIVYKNSLISKERKEAVIPKGRSTFFSYFLSCKEKACYMKFESIHEIIVKTPSKTKTAKTPL